MQKYLLTGQIGAGKSTALKLMAGERVLLISADDLVRDLYKEQPEVWTQIENALEVELRDLDGSANKSKLANVIFTDESALQKVEQIVHPLVAILLAEAQKNSSADFLVYENAVVRNPSEYSDFAGVIYIQADRDVRIERLLTRGLQLADIENRMKNEVPLMEFEIPVYEIQNNGNLESLTSEIESLKLELGMINHD